MSGTAPTELIRQVNNGGVDALMEECDRMEAELGEWLARRVASYRGRRELAINPYGQPRAFRPSFSRILIQIWATSPEARATFSGDARAGLVSATDCMDARTLISLVDGLLENARSAGTGPAAA